MHIEHYITIILLCIIINISDAQEYYDPYETVSDNLTAFAWNDSSKTFLKLQLYIVFNYEEETFYLHVVHPGSMAEIELKETFRDNLLANIKKYKERNKRAISDKLKIDELIGKLPLTQVYFEMNEENWCKVDSLQLETWICSQDKNNYWFIVESEGVNCEENSEPKHIELYFNDEDVDAFENAINNKINHYLKMSKRIDEIVKDGRIPSFNNLYKEILMKPDERQDSTGTTGKEK